jgi:hypothetical protein
LPLLHSTASTKIVLIICKKQVGFYVNGHECHKLENKNSNAQSFFFFIFLYLFLSYVCNEGNIPYHHIFWSASSLYISLRWFIIYIRVSQFSQHVHNLYTKLYVLTDCHSLWIIKVTHRGNASSFLQFFHSTRTSSMKGAVPKSFVTKQARSATVMWPFSRSP